MERPELKPRQIGTKVEVINGQKVKIKLISPGRASGAILFGERVRSEQRWHPDKKDDWGQTA